MANVRIQATRGWMMQEVQEPSEFAASKHCVDPSCKSESNPGTDGIGEERWQCTEQMRCVSRSSLDEDHVTLCVMVGSD
jgi:hypothetical protein